MEEKKVNNTVAEEMVHEALEGDIDDLIFSEQDNKKCSEK